ncbi:FAD-dependent oxidoreductase [Hydrogenophaga sp.]|uniref:FAD-dependent oxidoreductase n=1 Tax=Hydrogenophaga sp. TaxID=1904254 RepID=UPI003F6A8DE7
MKLAVVGSGVVGITTAYELALDGHEVTVFERRNTAAEESSFANGSLIAPGWNAFGGANGLGMGALMPWASAGTALNLGSWPRGKEWPWLWQWLRAGKAERQLTLQPAVHRLTQYSHERLQALAGALQLDYDRTEGMLVLWRTEQGHAKAQPALQVMADMGWKYRVLSAEEARLREPALNPDTALYAALEITGEASANCRQFALQLKAEAQKLGCRFEFGTTVERITPEANPSAGVKLTLSPTVPAARSNKSMHVDGAVLCAGAAGATLLRTLGVRLPVLPVFGHSVSAAVREPLDAPLSAVFDVRQQVSISRLGQRVRVCGGQQFGRSAGVKSAGELKRLYQVLSDWFPGAARMAGTHGSAQEWCGAQARLPDGLPALGPTQLPGVWVNLGHGNSGWSMACGSARLLADHIRGTKSDIDGAEYNLTRFGR